ncbi:response regulator [Labilibacter marinus]|uniref:response regulator n=1 Tax=Labilibacter marinus TaxID=1477105 RepID=UPI00082CDC56|nr:response regulator [Labilibacter marinus]
MDNKVKLLYVDDEDINLQLFQIHFRKKYNVFICSSAQDGLELMNEHEDINIIISDMKMPQMNGIEFIKKAKERFPNKKYYILTGFDITKEIQDALSTGLILKYFRKPFNIEEIDGTISQVLE